MAIYSLIDSSRVIKAGRWDAEHFRADYEAIEAKAKSLNAKLLGDLATHISRGVQPEYSEVGGIAVLRTVNIREEGFANTRQEFVSGDFYEQNTRGQVSHGDILITSTGVGTLGRVTFNHEHRAYFVDGHITIVRGVRDANPLFVTAFLQSRFGLILIEKRQRGSSGQIEIYPSDIASIPIPRPSDAFQENIASLCIKAQRLREQSAQLYAEAEALLLQQLGLNENKISYQNTYTASFKDTVSANRLNAEYFHPEKMSVLKQLNELPGRPISDYFDSIDELLNPLYNGTEELVHNYDLNDALKYFLDDDVPLISTYALGSTKKRFQQKDVVVSRLRSYLKEIAIIKTSCEHNCVGSTEFIVLRPRNNIVSPELLMIYLRCPYVQKVLKWCQNGSNHPRFEEREILALKLPDCIIGAQDDLQRMVRNSINCYCEARKIQEQAKQQIENMLTRNFRNVV